VKALDNRPLVKNEWMGDTDRTVWLARWALLLLTVVLSVGLLRISVDADPAELVASNSSRFAAYSRAASAFPGERQQVMVFTAAPAFSPDHLERYLSAHKRLLALPDVQSVASLFSVPSLQRPLRRYIHDPAAAVESGILETLRELLSQSDYLPSRLVSEQQDALLMTLQLHPSSERHQAIHSIEQALHEIYTSPEAISWSLAGTPVVGVAMSSDIWVEIFRVAALALLLGALVSWWVLGSLHSVAVAMAVPTAAAVSTLGLMGWFGIGLSLLSQTVLMVVFLVVYSDTLHTLRGGRSRHSLVVACGLTSLTTAGASAALLFSSSAVIREFAIALLLGIAAGFVVWILWLYSQTDQRALKQKWRNSAPWPVAKESPRALRDYGLICLTIVLAIPALQLRTGFSLDENLPRSHGTAKALSLAEKSFSGYLPLQVLVSEASPTSSTTSAHNFLTKITALQKALNGRLKERGVHAHRWHSIVDVLALTPGLHTKHRLASLPKQLRESLWNSSTSSVLMLVPWVVSDLLEGHGNTLPQLDKDIQQLTKEFGLRADAVTGLPALIQEASSSLVADAARSFLVMFLVLGVLVVAVLKSWRLSWLAALPVGMSIIAMAAALVLLDEPLRHAGVVMLTVCAGLAVDNGLHLIVAARHNKTNVLCLASLL